MRVLDSDLNEHAQKRASLIAAERSLRFDAEATRCATENEKRAVVIVNNIRVREATEIWHANKGMLMYPSTDFLTAKETISEFDSECCSFRQVATTSRFTPTLGNPTVTQLPKGGLLRGHSNTMCDVKFIYNLALEYPAIHIRVNSRITAGTPLPLPEFKPLSLDLVTGSAEKPSLTSADYVLGTWVPLSKARNEFLHGGWEAFDRWILGLLVLSVDQRSRDNIPPATTRERFLAAYRLARGIICYEPVLKRLLRQTILSLIEDGISYAEIRANFSYKTDISTDGSETFSHRDYLAVFNDVIREVKHEMSSEGREDEFTGAKLIYAVYRTLDKEKLYWYLEDCMALKTEFPDLIAGFDFLGPEEIGNPLGYYVEPLIWFQQETKKHGLNIPFIFLVGDAMGEKGKADNNIYDALLLGTKRIGHGLNLVRHPLLMQMVKERGVAVEVCPVGNEIFAIVGSESSNLLSLKQLARQSLEYSSLSPEDKEIALEAWERRWSAFVDTIVGGDLETRH